MQNYNNISRIFELSVVYFINICISIKKGRYIGSPYNNPEKKFINL